MSEVPSGTNGRVTYRDVTEMMSRLERDLHAGQSRIEGKIDAFIMTHANQHANEQSEFNKHLTEAAIRKTQQDSFQTTLEPIKIQVGSLMEWRAELRGMALLIKFALGTSALGVAISLITFINLLSKGW